MPLTPDVGHLAERYSGVHFVMFNGPDRVLCLAGYAALQDLGARHEMPEDYVQVFGHSDRLSKSKRAPS
jgi:hypothetical protein